MDGPDTAAFGQNCLLARRLVERGVRFVELYAGSGSGWDATSILKGTTRAAAGRVGQADRGPAHRLKSRGMLKDTW
jgi:hypothetical protein